MKNENIEVVAATDVSPESIKRTKDAVPDIRYYASLAEMLQEDIDAVFVVTPAFMHARNAIDALNAGKHVISEVTACWTMAEAVELYEAAKRSNRVYMLSENYCYFLALQEMRRIYRGGAIGELLFADCHYLATYKDMWAPYCCSNPCEWRNWMPQSYYSSHALGPVLWITGLRPVEVTGFAVPNGYNSASIGKRSDEVSNFVVKLNNGALVSTITSFIAPKTNHLWWHLACTAGEMENDRFYDPDDCKAVAIVNLVNDDGHTNYVSGASS